MSLSETAEIVGIVRDIVIILIIVAAMLATLIVFKKVATVLDSAKRTMENAEEVSASISSRFAGTTGAGSRVASGAGKTVAFILGLSKRWRKKGERGDGE